MRQPFFKFLSKPLTKKYLKIFLTLVIQVNPNCSFKRVATFLEINDGVYITFLDFYGLFYFYFFLKLNSMLRLKYKDIPNMA